MVWESLVNFLNEKRFDYDENNNEVTNRGKKLKIEPGTSVSIENLNALVEESVKTLEGNNRKKVPPPPPKKNHLPKW